MFIRHKCSGGIWPRESWSLNGCTSHLVLSSPWTSFAKLEDLNRISWNPDDDLNMLSTLVRRSAAAVRPFNPHTNPYKAKRHWPPDFDKLSQKHQFRMERRYRRRAKLKWARPRWTKMVKLAQWGSAICTLAIPQRNSALLTCYASRAHLCCTFHGYGYRGFAF